MRLGRRGGLGLGWVKGEFAFVTKGVVAGGLPRHGGWDKVDEVWWAADEIYL